MKHLTECLNFFAQSLSNMEDNRTGKNLTYSMKDIGMAAFSPFYMQCPSFLSFQRKLQENRGTDNTCILFQMDKIPTDNHIRKTLDGVAPEYFDDNFFHVIEMAGKAGEKVIRNVLDGRTLIALDGSEYFSSNKVCCPSCSKRTLRDGSIEYFHRFLAAVIVRPFSHLVFSLPPEFIHPQDGATKQDCEWRAAQRWLAKTAPRCRDYNPVYLGDDLFARQDICAKILNEGGDFIFTCKDTSHKTLREFRNGLEPETFQETKTSAGKKRNYRYSWLCNLPIRDGEDALTVNWIDLQISLPNGKVTYHASFITSLLPTRDNIVELAACARARWKIENETFNVLKNNGYHLEHNFGHGKKTLSQILVVFNLLAFSMHTLCDVMEEMWQKARASCGTRVEFFSHLWSITAYVVFKNWHSLMETILKREPPPAQ